jgi:hypothetical protein
MKRFTADFETCTWLEDETYVWAWAVCEIGNEKNIRIGTNIDDFIDYCLEQKNAYFYFHNLKFDGEFIIYWALKHGFKHVENIKDTTDKTFTTLISDMGQFYNITLYFEKTKNKCRKITFIDSLKIIPFSVKDIAKSFNLPISKLEIDYMKPRKKNHVLTKEEREYVKNDVTIVAMALYVLFKQKLTHMTQASNALTNYKGMITKSKFEWYFPKLDYDIDQDLRRAYRRRFYLS